MRGLILLIASLSQGGCAHFTAKDAGLDLAVCAEQQLEPELTALTQTAMAVIIQPPQFAQPELNGLASASLANAVALLTCAVQRAAVQIASAKAITSKSTSAKSFADENARLWLERHKVKAP